ncbi:hypothetical protein VFPPC_13809 [Pochonia chlamydosporia 170]|uniref:Uncharacterized protein n=1 Tax=Pochonia chlamydosporia 170 TaxID=1380566 RepID=A0A179FVG7_METCM|nr:hypothetical protein VFPPC_13809 [Pochonia chlamydosporia 170]OAQ69190.1 hypothetical protein VFPPC_13809 [Pochonia chlamydosporia 170]
MSINEDEVLRRVEAQPEEFVNWSRADMVDQFLTDAVLAAIRKARPGSTIDAAMDILNDMRRQIYNENLSSRIRVLGKSFVQFQMFMRACELFQVRCLDLAERRCPAQRTSPANLVYSTMYWKASLVEEAALVARMKAMISEAEARKAKTPRQEVKKRSAPEPMSNDNKRRSLDPLATHRFGTNNVAGSSTAEQSKPVKSTHSLMPARVVEVGPSDTPAPEPARVEHTAEHKGKGNANAGMSVDRLWVERMGTTSKPGWPAWPGFPHHECGPFDIPIHPDRDWDICFGAADVGQYVGPEMEIVCVDIGQGCRKLVVRLGGAASCHSIPQATTCKLLGSAG